MEVVPNAIEGAVPETFRVSPLAIVKVGVHAVLPLVLLALIMTTWPSSILENVKVTAVVELTSQVLLTEQSIVLVTPVAGHKILGLSLPAVLVLAKVLLKV